MSKLGGYIAIFGVASIILYFFNIELRILGWIHNWGTTVAWVIRIGLIVLGAALFFLGGRGSEEDEIEIQQPE